MARRLEDSDPKAVRRSRRIGDRNFPTRQNYLDFLREQGVAASEADFARNHEAILWVHTHWHRQGQQGCVFAQSMSSDPDEHAWARVVVPGTADDILGISPLSPCVDAGDNGALPRDTSDLDADGDSREPIPVDLDGGPRVLHDVVDMGAFETGDCNRNGVLDTQEIADGTSLDRNQNGLPDECEPYEFGDVDGDGDIDLADFLFFAQCFRGAGALPRGEDCCRDSSRGVPCESPADFDGDHDVDLSDLLFFQSVFTGSQ